MLLFFPFLQAGTLDAKSLVIATQYLNMLEAAMSYCAYKTQPDNVLLRDFVRLFKHHQHCVEKFKVRVIVFCNKNSNSVLLLSCEQKMEPKKGNKKQIAEASANASTLNASSKIGISFKPENIWDLATVERMLHISLE